MSTWANSFESGREKKISQSLLYDTPVSKCPALPDSCCFSFNLTFGIHQWYLNQRKIKGYLKEAELPPPFCRLHLEKGMATLSSSLAWRIPRTEEPGGLQSMGSQKVGHNWVTNTSLLLQGGFFFLSFFWARWVKWSNTDLLECENKKSRTNNNGGHY